MKRNDWGRETNDLLPREMRRIHKRKRATRDPLKKKKPGIVDVKLMDIRGLKHGKIGVVDRRMIHDKILAKQINADLIKNSLGAMKHYNKIILLAPHRVTELENVKKIKMLYPNTKVLLWWIGSDVLALNKLPKSVKFFRKFKNVNHLAVSQDLKEELWNNFKINSKVLPLVPNDGRQIIDLPKQYTVASYIPYHKRGFYNFKLVKEVARRCPDVKFIIYGNKEHVECTDNMEQRGWVNNVEGILKDSSCLLRQTDHEGFPKSAMEFIRAGRYVITNHNFPHVFNSGNLYDIVNKINGKPIQSKEAVVYYNTEFCVKNFKKRLMKAW